MQRAAVFIDFENIKRAVDDYFINERVDLKRILTEIAQTAAARIVLKRAYADWGAFKDYRSDLLDNATEPVQAFALTYKGKNGTDIRIAIDVMDVVLRQPEITHVALVSGDSDFTPLVNKLREFGRYVIGVGVRSNTSNYLAKACDTFLYYDDFRNAADTLPERSIPSTPMDPVRLLATALAALGNRPVAGSALKMRMRQLDPMFDETRQGHTSFLDFLRAHSDIIDVSKPQVGDIQVAPKGREIDAHPGENGSSATGEPPLLRDAGLVAYISEPPHNGAASAPLTQSDRYRLWLRDNNFRHVPSGDRRHIIGVLYDIFTEAEASGGISLKEAKDRLHAWFEENRPSVPWESVNSTVYHLFYTWCFAFDKTDEGDGKQLWDRRTILQSDILTKDDLINKCERGIARKLWERDRGEVDAPALNDWLFDGDSTTQPRVLEIIETVAAPTFAIVGRGG